MARKVKVLDQVTNIEYQLFFRGHKFALGEENKPVTEVNFRQAMDYAKWKSETTGRKFRLITEAEREAAEATFEADFSSHPLREVPDVGTFGKNADGVSGLLGVTYDWCAELEDILDPVALGWASAPQNQPPQNQAPQNQAPQNQAPQNQAPQNQAPQNQPPQNQAPQNQAPQPETTLEDLQNQAPQPETTLEDLRNLRDDLDRRIQAAEAALKVLTGLGIKIRSQDGGAR